MVFVSSLLLVAVVVPDMEKPSNGAFYSIANQGLKLLTDLGQVPEQEYSFSRYTVCLEPARWETLECVCRVGVTFHCTIEPAEFAVWLAKIPNRITN